jgi:hypothetical protein
MAYGEPRFTNDVDLLADLPASKVPELCTAFPPPAFYLAESAARDAIARRGQFNILHLPSGLQADVIIPPGDDFGKQEMTRGKRLTSEGEFSVWFSSAEDVILNKLRYFQLGGSEKHLRDIASICKVQGEKIDRAYIEHWSEKLSVLAEWQLICHRMRQP